jgi:hypothetical protein
LATVRDIAQFEDLGFSPPDRPSFSVPTPLSASLSSRTSADAPAIEPSAYFEQPQLARADPKPPPAGLQPT